MHKNKIKSLSKVLKSAKTGKKLSKTLDKSITLNYYLCHRINVLLIRYTNQ